MQLRERCVGDYKRPVSEESFWRDCSLVPGLAYRPQVFGQQAEEVGYFAAERLDPFGLEGVRFSLIFAALPVRSRR